MYYLVLFAHSNYEVIFLRYENLQQLILYSKSSRNFFLSLPTALQSALHEYNPYIHTASDLRKYADTVKQYQHSVNLSKMLF